MQLKGCSPNLDFCALCLRETCPKKAIEDFERQSQIQFLLCSRCHYCCPAFHHSEHASICSSILPFYQRAVQLLQIHSVLSAEMPSMIRRSQSAERTNRCRGGVCKVIFEKCPCHI